MLSQFFQLTSTPANQLFGYYDPSLVVLSYLVACFASYIALDFTGRLRDVSNTHASTLMWLVGGSIAMGAGIWSMHFIGMLSFKMSHMTFYYDLYWTGLSLLVAIIASAFALYLLKSKTFSLLHLAIGGIILGIGIASMHYTGMEAMKIQMNIHYLPSLFILSIIIAIIASEAALWLALKSNQVISRIRVRLKLISAAIMGLAICGMHYTGMAAAIFTPPANPIDIAGSLDPTFLSLSIAAVTFVILGIAFFASTYKEALNQQKLETARQLGMAEIATSVLHNVGNVLNSVNVSATLIAEKISNSKLDGLDNLHQLISEHQHDLAQFISADPRGSKIPEFINLLAGYWKNEKKLIAEEIIILNRNVHHIKNIISMQQGFSKMIGLEQIIQLDELIEEAILITGIETSPLGIIVDRKYEKLKSIVVNKVKLLQILVNVFTNAKDALRESNKPKKCLCIKTCVTSTNKILIEISDNGIGISAKNIKSVFSYGFTTKETGHGFGLHTCALAMNEMGGTISVDSKGIEEGTTFFLELPYRLPKS